MNISNKPIGIFDSGVGGLSIWKEIYKTLPNESVIYLADSANCPYGSKSHDEILKLSIKNVDYLLSKGCKLIVVACNTATAAAIEILRSKYDIPFIGMEPAVKPASLNSKSGNIGVLATQGTFNGKLFKETKEKYANNVNVHVQIGDGLVEVVESGDFNGFEAEQLIKSYILPMNDNNVDQLVLGCTHYPFLIPVIEKFANDNMVVINPAIPVTLQTKNQLDENNIINTETDISKYSFYTNGDSEILKNILSKITDVDYELSIIDR